MESCKNLHDVKVHERIWRSGSEEFIDWNSRFYLLSLTMELKRIIWLGKK